MRRRDMFSGFAVGVGALFGLQRASAATTDPTWPKVVYHLSDADKVGFVLGNIRNHYEGTDGRVTIALVVHGPALGSFRTAGVSAAISNRFAALMSDGLAAHACGNTMHGMDIGLGDLVPGFVNAEKGGVVRLAQLQGEGYAYLRP